MILFFYTNRPKKFFQTFQTAHERSMKDIVKH